MVINKDQLKLVKLSTLILDRASTIGLHNGQIEIGDERFIAVGLEKSKAAKNWEDTDYFNIIVVTKASDRRYYIRKIEHPADVLSPKYIEDELNIYWVDETKQETDKELIGDLYTVNDSRDRYTLAVQEKPHYFYEKYICYTISVSYELWENYDKTEIEVSPFLNIRCQFSSQHPASALEDTPTTTLKYRIDVCTLLQTSVFQYCPFEVWNGKVSIDGINVTLESNHI